MADTTFVAVVNDTNPDNNGQSYNMTVSGNNLSQFLGKKIGDVVDGIFVGEGDKTLAGYKLQITGGSDKTGTPMRSDLDGGTRQSVLVTASTGFKGHNLVHKAKGGEKRRFPTSQTACAREGTSVVTPSHKIPDRLTSKL